MAAVCKYNQKGFCKFGDHCRNRHINEICGSVVCAVEDCGLRHPLACRFHILNGLCKFGNSCAYLHKDSEEKLKIGHLEIKLNATEDRVKELEDIIKEIKIKLEDSENDASIDDTIQQRSVPSVHEIDNKENGYSCHFCNFVSTWENGLVVHMGRIHKQIEQLDGMDTSVGEEQDNYYLNMETYWRKKVIGRSFQSFLDANKLIEESSLDETEKKTEKSKVLGARKIAFGDDFKY